MVFICRDTVTHVRAIFSRACVGVFRWVYFGARCLAATVTDYYDTRA